jgi:SAM-dependent methyltransferase
MLTEPDITESARRGCQTIYSKTGQVLLGGIWDSRAIYRAVTGPDDNYWRGRRVLDIGANTSGLSVEIARRGGRVVAIEPDPYGRSQAVARDVLTQIISDEALDMSLGNEGLFDAHKLGRFDTVLCLGLIYHFRDQQFVLDYLSTIDMDDLIISSQTHPSDNLAIFNRMDSSVPMPTGFWADYAEPLSGWHPTRPMLERMLKYAGFEDVTALTDRSKNFPTPALRGATNSAYYRGRKVRSVDPVAARMIYHPR